MIELGDLDRTAVFKITNEAGRNTLNEIIYADPLVLRA